MTICRHPRSPQAFADRQVVARLWNQGINGRVLVCLKDGAVDLLARYVEEEGFEITTELYDSHFIFFHASTFGYVLSKGLDANHFKQWNQIEAIKKTPLMHRVQFPENIKVLLAHGADPALKDEQSFTAFKHALEQMAFLQKMVQEDGQNSAFYPSRLAGVKETIELLKPYADQQELDELVGMIKVEGDLAIL